MTDDKLRAVKTAVDDIYNRQHPSGNVHLPEWEIGYVSTSRIVKKTAHEYAHTIKCQKDGKRPPDSNDSTDGFWSFKGNATADASLPRDDGWVHEIETEVPVPEFYEEPFTLRAHLDGVRVINDYLVADEHKSFIQNQPDKDDHALRQALLGVALMFRQADLMLDDEWPITRDTRAADIKHHSTGERFVRFYPIEFTKRGMFRVEDEGHIDIYPHTEPGGIVKTVVEETPPRGIGEGWEGEECYERGANEGHVTDRDELDAILDFYLDKSRAILEAVREDDLDIAMEWDMEHAHEFAREYECWEHAPKDVFEAYAEYEYHKQKKKEHDQKRRRASNRVKEALREEGVSVAENEIGEVSLQKGATGRSLSVSDVEDALDHVREADEVTMEDVNNLVRCIESSITPGRTYSYPTGSLEEDIEELVNGD